MKNDILMIINNTTIIKFLIAVIVMYCFDFVTGFAKAWSNHNIQSNKLRQGVSKAIQYFVFVGIGVLCDFLFNQDKVTIVMCISVCVIELKSLAENFKEINLKIPDFILRLFGENIIIEDTQDIIEEFTEIEDISE